MAVTAVAEKYRILRPVKWMGVDYVRDDVITRATILKEKQVGVSRLASMQRQGFMEMVRSFDTLTKAELVDYGREVGADVDQNMVKKDLIAAIEGVL